jgi:CCR4-NOT transcriptional regulation complex NOT5 subunit
MVEDDDQNTHLSLGTDGSDEGDEKPSAKLQGKILQVRAKLIEKDQTINAQAEEIKSLRSECEDYKDDEAREKMKSYIEGLEIEKKFFIEEIAKLKEINEKASMSSSYTKLPPSSSPRESISSIRMISVTEVSSQYSSTVDDEISTKGDSFAPWGSSQNFDHRGSTASTTTLPTTNRRQSASAWRSFSTRLFGGVEEVDDAPPEMETEADKMLDDLTNDL